MEAPWKGHRNSVAANPLPLQAWPGEGKPEEWTVLCGMKAAASVIDPICFGVARYQEDRFYGWILIECMDGSIDTLVENEQALSSAGQQILDAYPQGKAPLSLSRSVTLLACAQRAVQDPAAYFADVVLNTKKKYESEAIARVWFHVLIPHMVDHFNQTGNVARKIAEDIHAVRELLKAQISQI